MFASIFILGSFWFWTLMVASFVLMVMLVEVWDRPYSAAGTVITVLVALHLLGDLNIWRWVLDNPSLLGAGALSYLLTGTIWSFAKWYIFVRDRKEAVEDARHEFKKDKKLDTNAAIPEENLESWYDILNGQRQYIYGAYRNLEIPSAREYKGRIVMWMTYWPWSMVFSLMADLVRQVFNTIYARLSSTYQRISNAVFGDVVEEFAAATQHARLKEEKAEAAREAERLARFS